MRVGPGSVGVSVGVVSISVVSSIVQPWVSLGISSGLGFSLSRPLATAPKASGGESGSTDSRPGLLVTIGETIVAITIVWFSHGNSGKSGQQKKLHFVAVFLTL